jgi:hypothetical protein
VDNISEADQGVRHYLAKNSAYQTSFADEKTESQNLPKLSDYLKSLDSALGFWYYM